MKCPVDKKDMIVVEHQKIELDYCLQCEGVWFDSGELDLLVSTLAAGEGIMSINDLLTPPEGNINESRRKCPICSHKMDKVWMGKTPKVMIDSCPSGDGLWFDGGELHQILHQMGKINSKDVLSFLGNAFMAENK